MDIHKPKPWHGVREFLKEYAIIVVGVLTALGAEQAVEWLHTDHEISESRAALRAEIANNAGGGLTGSEQGRCLLVWAERTRAWANGGPRPPSATPVGATISSVVWDASRSGAVLRMPLGERLKFAGFYDSVARVEMRDREVRDALTRAYRYTRGQKLTPSQAQSLDEEMNALEPLLATLTVDERTMVRLASRMGGKPRPGGPGRRLVGQFCRAIGAPAPTFELDGDVASDFDWYARTAGDRPSGPARP